MITQLLIFSTQEMTTTIYDFNFHHILRNKQNFFPSTILTPFRPRATIPFCVARLTQL